MDNDRQSLNFINDVRACPTVIYFRFQALPQHHRCDSGGAKTTNLRDEFGEQVPQQDAVLFHHLIGERRHMQVDDRAVFAGNVGDQIQFLVDFHALHPHVVVGDHVAADGYHKSRVHPAESQLVEVDQVAVEQRDIAERRCIRRHHDFTQRRVG